MDRHCCQCGRPFSAEDRSGEPRCPSCLALTTAGPAGHGYAALPPTAPEVPQAGSAARGATVLGAPAWLVVLGAVGLLAFLAFYFVVPKMREEAARIQEANNLKQMALAMHNFNDSCGHFPAAAAYYTKDGKPGLSWRVALLPFVESDNLLSQFNLDEPWDSPHNLRLLPKMPRYYLQPGQEDDGSGLTYYQVFVGPGTLFEEPRNRVLLGDGPRAPVAGLRLNDLVGGNLSTKILILAGKNPVPWTKPEDLPYHPDKPLPPLSDRFGGCQYATSDAGVEFIPRGTPDADIRARVSRHSRP